MMSCSVFLTGVLPINSTTIILVGVSRYQVSVQEHYYSTAFLLIYVRAEVAPLAFHNVLRISSTILYCRGVIYCKLYLLLSQSMDRKETPSLSPWNHHRARRVILHHVVYTIPIDSTPTIRWLLLLRCRYSYINVLCLYVLQYYYYSIIIFLFVRHCY